MNKVVKVPGYKGIWEVLDERNGYMIVTYQGAYLVIDEQCNPIMAEINNWTDFNEKNNIPMNECEIVRVLNDLRGNLLRAAKGFAHKKEYKEAKAIKNAISIILKENANLTPDTNYSCSICGNHKTFKEINSYETYIDQEQNCSTDKFLMLDKVICSECGEEINLG